MKRGADKMAAEAEWLELRLRVPLPSARVARVALGALAPDLPLPHPAGRGGGAPRPHPSPQLECNGEQLLACWVSPGARGLRGGVSSFLELLGLVLETIERFGGGDGGGAPPPAADPPPAPQ